MADSTDLQKRYLYKSFTSAGVFLGLIPNVTSKFVYNQLLYTAFAQTSITVGQTADTAAEDVEVLETENGLPITTEAGANITTERQPDMVGATNSKALIANDRLIEIWEFSRYWPNGKLVFSGYISRWKVKYGDTNDIEITCLSKGTDLQNYLIPGGTADTRDQSQLLTDGTGPLSFWSGRSYGQTWKTGSGVTNLSKIILKLQGSSDGVAKTFTLKIYDAPGGNLLGSTSVVVTSAVLTTYTFTFGTPITLTALTTYFFSLEVDASSSSGTVATWVGLDGWVDGATDKYANGVMWRNLGPGWITNAGGVAGGANYDFYFDTYYSGFSTKTTYTSSDVATILNAILDYYVSSGGAVAKSGTYPGTGKLATYTFNINTTLDGIQKVQELGPVNYFWFVDPATNILYYQAAGTTADHYIIKGRHIDELSIEASKENIVNVVYFTGGDDGSGLGTNVYVNVNDATSLLNNRRGLARISDPKVIGTSGAGTGRVLAQNLIDSNNAQIYITEVTITDDTYDISLYTLGQMVQPEGFGTFPDRLLLQIVGIKREEDKVTLSLGTLRKRATAQVEEIQSSLQATQTVDNPTSPS